MAILISYPLVAANSMQLFKPAQTELNMIAIAADPSSLGFAIQSLSSIASGLIHHLDYLLSIIILAGALYVIYRRIQAHLEEKIG